MRRFAFCLCLVACSSAPSRPSLPDAGAIVAMDAAPLAADAASAQYDLPPVPINDSPDVIPAARLAGDPMDFDFGGVAIGSAPRSNAFVVTNVGDAQTRALTASLSPAPELRLDSNCTGRQLMPGETCVVTATFLPTSLGMKMASGSVDDGSGAGAVSFTVKGTGRPAPDAGPDVAGPDVGGSDAPRESAPDVLPTDVSPHPDVTSPLDATKLDAAAGG